MAAQNKPIKAEDQTTAAATTTPRPNKPIKTEPKTITGEVIGIDLGTTYSCVAVVRNGAAEIIPNDQGNRTTPSCVAFTAAAGRLIGDAAKNQAGLNPRRTIFDAKRLIGKKFHDADVQTDLKYLPYPVVENGGKPYVAIEGVKPLTPEEVSAMILRKMKETAETYLGTEVNDAVVTVPAYFNDAQRQATKDAGRIAGLNVVRIVNEPTAAAIAYGFNDRKRKRRGEGEEGRKRKVLVYDLGGGTFDVSVLEIEGREFRVLATGGDTHLGGGDFDQKVEPVAGGGSVADVDDIGEDSRALGRLRVECERAKRLLSSQTQARVEIDSLFRGIDFSEVLTRAKFEELNLALFRRTIEIVKKTLKDARLEKSEVDEIVLVGGSTRIPKVREMLKEMFDGKEPSQGVNPDEAVACGAAVLAANMRCRNDAATEMTLFDVTPLSLGYTAVGDVMSVMVPRNTPIPTKVSRIVATVVDWQTNFSIKVLQGERVRKQDCLELGRFILPDIPPAKRGVSTAELTYDVDVDGILTVTAKNNAASKNSETLVLENYKGNLTAEEVEKMVVEAEQMAKDDRKVKERVDARNRLERYIYNVEGAARDKTKIYWDEGDKRKVEDALEEAGKWLDSDTLSGASSAKEEYETRMQKLAELWDSVKSKVYVLVDDD
ncbi:unnamed protein product [Linum tenue]|uniref:Uncharacterized protein n=1 Tax=Linum tenue TaxID=586396 RepID=A0AAV0PAQ4_9ROSI|nr:unnamed protein product [Linum tenue]